MTIYVKICLICGGYLLSTALCAQTASITTEMHEGVPWVLVSFEHLPTNITEFRALQAQLENTPEGAAAILLIALHLYQVEAIQGTKALIAACGGAATRAATSPPSPAHNAYEGKALRTIEYARIQEQLKRYPKLSTAYFVGASPKNGYSPMLPYRIAFSGSQGTDNTRKVFAHTLGAASKRPLRLILQEGVWRVEEYSSVLLGVQE